MNASKLNPLAVDSQVLANYLETHVKGFVGPIELEKFSGGQSNPTFLVRASSGKYVLRKKPPGVLLKSAHAIDREFRVISALSNTDVPVAKAYHLCTDNTVIGSMFYIMEFIDGRVMWDPSLPGFSIEERSTIYRQMVSTLAKLHSVNIKQVGLEDYGRPGNYYDRQVKRWTTQYRASELEKLPTMEALIKWLPANLPADDGRVSLVHGDYRLDNLMFDNLKPKVLALVDWELSTLGHPFADLAYQCMQLRLESSAILPGLKGVNRNELGIPSEDEYVAQYCHLMGINKIPDWNFYLLFSFFRLASIVQGVRKRAADGNASNKKAKETGELIYPLLEQASSLLHRI